MLVYGAVQCSVRCFVSGSQHLSKCRTRYGFIGSPFIEPVSRVVLIAPILGGGGTSTGLIWLCMQHMH